MSTEPAAVTTTRAASNGALNAGPVVRYSVPAHRPGIGKGHSNSSFSSHGGATGRFEEKSHVGDPSPSWVAHIVNSAPACCSTARPQPGSAAFHHRPLSVGSRVKGSTSPREIERAHV